VRSIRLSLMIYFLALLGVVLAAVSVLVYRNAKETLLEKQAATVQLIDAQYQESCRKERERLEYALLAQARTMAWLVEVQWPDRHSKEARRFNLVQSVYRTGYPQLSSLWLLGTISAPNAQATTVGALLLGVPNPLGVDPRHPNLLRIKFDEDDLAEHLDLRIAQYRQADDNYGGAYRSPSLGEHVLPFDPSQFTSDQVLDWRHDIVALEPNCQVLRVILKVVPRRFPRSTASARPPPGFPPLPPPVRPLGGVSPFPPPGLFIQCACDLNQLNQAIAGFEQTRQRELTELNERSDESLAWLRHRLILISLLTFAGTVFGGFWLVRLGLAPLRRLSEAVSRVSPRDFRLPLEERRMPRELTPIVERLTETLDMLKRAFTREKQAAADISHELRTPLAALLTTIEVTLRKPRSPEDYREVLMECRASGQQMSNLVERLLALARLDAGVDQLRPQPVDVSELAEECAALVRPLAEARGLKLLVERNGPAMLRADPAKLREVMTNLLHNAIQYNRPDGSVQLKVAREHGCLEVEVKDTGIGISTEARQHIFERFYRADPARSADGLHAGLGLSIVKGYVDLMGGTIAVESIEGEGSTFRVRVPVK
jgi:heavy metal sensor kinase